MKTEKEIKDRIKYLEKSFNHVLTGSMATIDINAPRALMQLSASSTLDGLYFALNKERPKYEYEK